MKFVAISLTTFIVLGLLLQRRQPNFTEVAPTIFARCSYCHNHNGNGPFPLTSFDEIHKRSKTIAAVIVRDYMPPSQVYGDFPGLFYNEAVTKQEREIIRRWAYFGASQDVASELHASPPKRWTLGKPTTVIMGKSAQMVPAQGDLVRMAYEISPRLLSRIRSIQAFDVRVRGYAIRYLELIRKTGATEQCLGTWSIASGPWSCPPGSSWPLKRGDRLVTRFEALPTGKAVRPSFDLALYQGSFEQSPDWISAGLPTVSRNSEGIIVSTRQITVSNPFSIICVRAQERKAFAFSVRIAYPTGEAKQLFGAGLTSDFPTAFNLRYPVAVPLGSRILVTQQYMRAKPEYGTSVELEIVR